MINPIKPIAHFLWGSREALYRFIIAGGISGLLAVIGVTLGSYEKTNEIINNVSLGIFLVAMIIAGICVFVLIGWPVYAFITKTNRKFKLISLSVVSIMALLIWVSVVVPSIGVILLAIPILLAVKFSVKLGAVGFMLSSRGKDGDRRPGGGKL